MTQPLRQKRGKVGQLSFRTPVQWMEEHQRALDQLVHMLSNPPVVGYPDFNLLFVLHTNASEKGLGAVLYQRQAGKPRVIVYGSRQRRVKLQLILMQTQVFGTEVGNM